MKLSETPFFRGEVTIPTILVTQEALESYMEIWDLDDSPLDESDYSLHGDLYSTDEEWIVHATLLQLAPIPERPTSPCIIITREDSICL